MIKDLKLGIKLMKQGYGRNVMMITSIIMILLGIANLMLENSTIHSGAPVGGYLILTVSVFPAQMFLSVGYVGITQSSPLKKRLETRIPAVLTGAFMVVSYLIILAFLLVFVLQGQLGKEAVVEKMLMNSIWIVILSSYIGCAFKYCITSICGFVVAVILNMVAYGAGLFAGMAQSIPLWAACVMGFLAIIVGSVLHYGIALLCYRKPYRKEAHAAMLRKQL